MVTTPRDDGDVLAVMRAVRADGVRRMEVDPVGDITYNYNGLRALLHVEGLEHPPAYRPDALGPDTAFLLRHPVPPGGPEPCGRFDDGQGVYVALQDNVVVPFETYNFYCPR